MEYLQNILTSKSLFNLASIDNKTHYIELPKNLLELFDTYKKVFRATKTEIKTRKSKNEQIEKKYMTMWYKSNIDTNVDDNYCYIKELNTTNVYDAYVKSDTYFNYKLFSNDVDTFSKVIHLNNIFNQFVYTNNDKLSKIYNSEIIETAQRDGDIDATKFTPKEISAKDELDLDRYRCKVYVFPNTLERKLVGTNYDKNHLSLYKKQNSAFTTSGETKEGTNSLIFTKTEELSKLMIHEMLHYFDMDGKVRRDSEYLQQIRNKMPFNDTNMENESIAELFCNIYNIFNIVCVLTNDYNISDETQIKLLVSLINIEVEYNIYVIAKFLKYFSINPNDLFNWSTNRENKIELVSPINLYYIIKCVMYMNLGSVFDDKNIVITPTKNGKFIESKETIFCDIKDKINDEEFVKRLTYYINKPTLMENLNVSYICLDIDISKIKFNDVSVSENYDDSEIIRELKSNIKKFIEVQNKKMPQIGGSNFYDKYLKYKKKYLSKKLKNKNN